MRRNVQKIIQVTKPTATTERVPAIASASPSSTVPKVSTAPTVIASATASPIPPRSGV